AQDFAVLCAQHHHQHAAGPGEPDQRPHRAQARSYEFRVSAMRLRGDACRCVVVCVAVGEQIRCLGNVVDQGDGCA
ncbi:hypothetical protein, partial [Xanthomonas campestris]|uniref:hypothetical protein n=1 Tax=Xanthomonas campestris TaxID=339 RepID=UPI002AD2206A